MITSKDAILAKHRAMVERLDLRTYFRMMYWRRLFR